PSRLCRPPRSLRARSPPSRRRSPALKPAPLSRRESRTTLARRLVLTFAALRTMLLPTQPPKPRLGPGSTIPASRLLAESNSAGYNPRHHHTVTTTKVDG